MGNLIKKILIAPNSYKESMDSVSAAKLFSDYLKEENLELITLPLSDGGDGFLEVCKMSCAGAREIEEDNNIHYLYDPGTQTVYIESAQLFGMKVIAADKRNPLLLNSCALGDVLLHLRTQVEHGKLDIKEVVIGVGGTATMDMALGAASLFGLKLFDENGIELPVSPGEFINVRKIALPEADLPFSITAVNDVNNPLLGIESGFKVYGPQKGASEDDIALVEKGIGNILCLIPTGVSTDLLSGAGGGLSAGLLLFFKAQMKTSEQFILQDLGLIRYLDKVDYVITGEGKFDNQSFYNKAVGLVIKTFPDTPLFLCCGIIDDLDLPDNIIPLELSRYFNSREESMHNMPRALQMTSEVIKEYISQR